MQITVRDDAPDIGDGVSPAGSGWVHANVDDQRYQEMADFIRSNPSIMRGNGGGAMYGRTGARDATEAESFAIGQLTYLEAKAFARWYQPLRYQQLLAGCIDTSAGPYAKAIDYLVSDMVGVGQFISAATSNTPMVDVAYNKITIPVALGGIGYDYTQEDLRTSAFLRQPLSSTKQTAAVMAYQRHCNRVALQGDTPNNFKGLYNNAGATAAACAHPPWTSGTGADNIIGDIIAAYAAFVAATAGNAVPTMIIFPLSTFQILYTPRASVSDTTIAAFITQTLNVQIMSDAQLETLGVGGSLKRVVFAATNEDNMVFHTPMPLQFLAPQLNGYRVVVPGEYKIGGFELRRVQTVRYMDQV